MAPVFIARQVSQFEHGAMVLIAQFGEGQSAFAAGAVQISVAEKATVFDDASLHDQRHGIRAGQLPQCGQGERGKLARLGGDAGARHRVAVLRGFVDHPGQCRQLLAGSNERPGNKRFGIGKLQGFRQQLLQGTFRAHPIFRAGDGPKRGDGNLIGAPFVAHHGAPAADAHEAVGAVVHQDGRPRARDDKHAWAVGEMGIGKGMEVRGDTQGAQSGHGSELRGDVLGDAP